MKTIELPDDIAALLEKVPAAARGEFLIRNGFRRPQALKNAKATAVSGNFQLFTDGASRGNPGHSGIGFVLRDAHGKTFFEGKEYLGVATNNVAEWTALLTGLKKSLELGVRSLECFLDSELVVKQMKGEYKIKHANLQGLAAEARDLIRQFDRISFQHILREKNFRADQLSNEAIDTVLGKVAI